MHTITLRGGALDGSSYEVSHLPTFLSFPVQIGLAGGLPRRGPDGKRRPIPTPPDATPEVYRKTDLDPLTYARVKLPCEEHERYVRAATIENPEERAAALQAEGFE